MNNHFVSVSSDNVLWKEIEIIAFRMEYEHFLFEQMIVENELYKVRTFHRILAVDRFIVFKYRMNIIWIIIKGRVGEFIFNRLFLIIIDVMPFIGYICVSFAFNFAQILQNIVLYGRVIRFLFSYHFRMNVVFIFISNGGIRIKADNKYILSELPLNLQMNPCVE